MSIHLSISGMQNDGGHMTTSAALVCKNSVREIRYDCLTTCRISCYKSRIFRGLLTYPKDLRVPQEKKIKGVKSHDLGGH